MDCLSGIYVLFSNFVLLHPCFWGWCPFYIIHKYGKYPLKLIFTVKTNGLILISNTWIVRILSIPKIQNYNINFRLPWCLSWKRIPLQCRRPGFDPWVGKIPWWRAWQPTPVFLPGESPWTEESGRLLSWGHKESDMTKQLRAAIGPEMPGIFDPTVHSRDEDVPVYKGTWPVKQLFRVLPPKGAFTFHKPKQHSGQVFEESVSWYNSVHSQLPTPVLPFVRLIPITVDLSSLGLVSLLAKDFLGTSLCKLLASIFCPSSPLCLSLCYH